MREVEEEIWGKRKTVKMLSPLMMWSDSVLQISRQFFLSQIVVEVISQRRDEKQESQPQPRPFNEGSVSRDRM